MTPLRFGSINREMLGILGSPGAEKGDLAVLFCNPFGQEAVRSKPMYRVFAERLLRQGVHTLRFDYHGTGDSPGEGDEQSLGDWVHDTRMAREALLRATGATRLQVFGLGLGATIAALMAFDVTPVPERLILWQPITKGVAYLERMQAVHREELARAFSETWPVVRQILQTTEPQAPGFILGFPVGQRLTRDLTALDELSLKALAERGCHIDCATSQDMSAQPGGHENIRWHRARQDANWMSNESFGAAIVSPEILSVLFDGLDTR